MLVEVGVLPNNPDAGADVVVVFLKPANGVDDGAELVVGAGLKLKVGFEVVAEVVAFCADPPVAPLFCTLLSIFGGCAKRVVVVGVLPVESDVLLFGNWKTGVFDEACCWLDVSLFPAPNMLLVPVLAPKVEELGGGPEGVVDCIPPRKLGAGVVEPAWAEVILDALAGVPKPVKPVKRL